MLPTFNVFLNLLKIDISGAERSKLLHPLLNLLRANPTKVGRVLYGLKKGPWTTQDVREIELLIASRSDDKRMMAGYLSILHQAVLLWSATTRQLVPLPHFLPPERESDNPFSKDFSTALSVHTKWKTELSNLVGRLHDADSEAAVRDLRLAALLVSAIVYGGVFGAPFLVALVRAIPDRKRRTFVVGRVHIELSLADQGVVDAEQRIWLPDPLTGTLWSLLDPTDADELLAPVIRDGKSSPPGDAVVIRRIDRLIQKFQMREDEQQLAGIEELRQCAREVCVSECAPSFVAYSNSEFRSESLRRGDVRRLFPSQPLLELEKPAESEPEPSVALDSAGQIAAQPEPEWMDLLLAAARSDSVLKRLSCLATNTSVPAALRLVADFGTALGSRTSRSGKPIPARKIAETVIFIARSLGCILADQDLATLESEERRKVYLVAINQQPVRERMGAVQAIREFELYLVAQINGAIPVPKSKLPWILKDNSVSPELITHHEYFEILNRIEGEWSVRSGARERKMVRLLVVLAFRAGLRRGELRGLRMEDVLILGFAWLQIRNRKVDPLKSRNAQRGFPVGALLSREEPNDELQEIRDWYRRRVDEGAKATDYFFTMEGKKRIPNSLFDDVNTFLRKLTPQANDGKGVHMHTLRHAAGTWLFVSLTLSNSKRRDSLFADLKETHDWLREGKSHWLHFAGNTTPSKKVPFITAAFCGHANFDTTASSYINIFPWLVAHALDGVECMRPDPELVRKASGVPLKLSKKWLRYGDAHNIPVQLLLRQGASVRDNVQIQPDNLLGTADWLMSAWKNLMRHGMSDPGTCANAEDKPMFERADWLMARHDRNGNLRHPFESHPKSRIALAVPRKPEPHKKVTNSTLLDLIAATGAEGPAILSDAVGVFAVHHTQDGFIEFESISELEAADCYIGLLRNLGFQKRELELVSGDADEDSECRHQWRDELSEPYLHIRPCPPGRNYGFATSLWVRPSVTALAKRKVSPANFRFMMAMAFIVFGRIPQEIAQVPTGKA